VRCRDLAAQPSKLSEFIAFRLRVKEVQHARDRVSGLRPAQVQDMYAAATSWGGRLPHTDQVRSRVLGACTLARSYECDCCSTVDAFSSERAPRAGVGWGQLGAHIMFEQAYACCINGVLDCVLCCAPDVTGCRGAVIH
jgi:hypothetical protein